MTPNSNNETADKKDNKKTITQISTKPNTANKAITRKHKNQLSYRQRLEAIFGHVPEYCLMCSNHRWKIDEQFHYMGLNAFTHHLTLMMGSDGQRLNKEIISAMYNRYRKIITSERTNSLRLISNEANRPHFIFTISVLT